VRTPSVLAYSRPLQHELLLVSALAHTSSPAPQQGRAACMSAAFTVRTLLCVQVFAWGAPGGGRLGARAERRLLGAGRQVIYNSNDPEKLSFDEFVSGNVTS
jgi:hypothetical protein